MDIEGLAQTVRSIDEKQKRHSAEFKLFELSYEKKMEKLEENDLVPMRTFLAKASEKSRIMGFLWALGLALVGSVLLFAGAGYNRITEGNERSMRLEERQKALEKNQEMFLDIIKRRNQSGN